MMIYELTTRAEMHGIIEYEHDLSVDPTLFLENFSLAGLTGELIYTVKKKSDIKKLEKFHMLGSGGPMLISDQLREVIEQNIVDEAEFFRAKVLYKDEEINGFSAINIVHAVSCINMDKSEYEQMNFDAADPEYDFSYYVLKDEFEGKFNIAASSELGRSIIVTEAIKSACAEKGLSGLLFCRAIDTTYNDRTICTGASS